MHWQDLTSPGILQTTIRKKTSTPKRRKPLPSIICAGGKGTSREHDKKTKGNQFLRQVRSHTVVKSKTVGWDFSTKLKNKICVSSFCLLGFTAAPCVGLENGSGVSGCSRGVLTLIVRLVTVSLSCPVKREDAAQALHRANYSCTVVALWTEM